MEHNSTEIEEKNKIDYSSYSEQPEKLFTIAKEKLNKNEFEEAIEILEQAILLAIKKFGGEEKVQLAIFYQKYADAILQKLFNNQDFLNIDQNEIDEKSQKNQEEDQKEEKTETKENDQEKKEGNEEISDEQIIFDNLNMADYNLKTFLKEYDDKNPKNLDKEIIKYYLLLSDNYSLFAEKMKITRRQKKFQTYAFNGNGKNVINMAYELKQKMQKKQKM